MRYEIKESVMTLSRFIISIKDVFSKASRGEFYQEDERVRKMKDDLFEEQSSPANDKENLKGDWKMVGKDVHNAWIKLKTENV